MPSPSATPTPLTPPRVPLIDPRTGLIDRAWYMFFLSLFNASEIAIDSQKGPSLESLLASYEAALNTLAQRVDTLPDSQTPELQQQIDVLRQEIRTQASDQTSELQQQINDLFQEVRTQASDQTSELQQQVNTLRQELQSQPSVNTTEIEKTIHNLAQEFQTAPQPQLGTFAALQQANLPWTTFDTTPSSVPPDIGTLAWDGGTTLGVQMTANVLLKVGEAEFVYAKASATITKGQLCYHTGAVGSSGVTTVAPSPIGLTDPNQIVGVAAESIALNDFGLIQISGDLRGFDTTGSSVGEVWADGDPLYYNPAFVGSMTKNKPSAPNIKSYIGEVINAGGGGSGSMHIRIVPGSVLGGTDSNVQFGVLANNDLIQYDSVLTYWKNVASSSVTVGYANNLKGGATGSVPYQSATDTTTFLPIGSALQVLKVNAGATAPEWVTGAALSKVDDTNVTLTLGGTPTTSLLAATSLTLGWTGQLGEARGGTAQSTYAKGDILYASAANTLAKLPIGSNNQILRVATDVPDWEDVSTLAVTSFSAGTTGLTPATATTGAVTLAGILSSSNGGTGINNGGRTLTISTNSGTLAFGAASKTLTVNNSLTLAGTDATTMTFPSTSASIARIDAAQTFTGTQTFSNAVTMSATTENLALGTSQTSGTWTAGGPAQTGTLTLDQSTKTHILNIGTGATESAATKTINIGTGGVATSTTAITIGSASGTTVTLNGTVNAGTVNATTLDLTNIEVTNIKAKDGTASASIADTTGAFTVSAAFAANGNVTLGDASADTVTVNGTSTFTAKPTVQLTSAATNTVTQVMRLDSQSSGTPAAGIGVGLEFAAETAAGNTEVGATLEAITTDVTAASEDFDLSVKLMIAGAAATEVARFKPTGLTIATGDTYQINGTDVLSATTLGSGVVTSSLTTVGTIGTGVWQGTVVGSTYGGTGINNAGRTLTISTNSGTIAFSGASTTMTFPAASATLAGLGTTQTFTGINTFTPAARTSGVASYFTLTTPADTGQTASTESIGANFTAATRTWATGALTLQRERVFAAPTYAFAGASTLTTAVNVDIAAPVAGANATITNAYALRAAASQFTGAVNITGLTASKPVFTDANKNLTSTGTVPVDQGGTGQTTYTDGQLLIGNTTGNTLTKATLTAGSGVSITNGAGSISISATGLGGDVVGPASSTDNAVVRFDGTTGKLVQNSAVTIADTTGNITGGAYNKVTITAPATSATLTIADGKTLTANNSLTLAGTDATTMTFPTTSATIARTDAAQTFTGTQTVLAAATQDAVALAGRAGGTGSFVATITPTTLSASRTITLPNLSGTVALLSNTQTFSGATTFSSTFTLSGTTTNIALGTSQTTGTWTAGGTGQTGAMTLGQSTAAQTVNIATGATATATTKTVNIGTAGVSGSTTNLTYGSAVSGATVTHTWNAGAEFVALDSSANLGIGTAAPAYSVDISRAAPRIRQVATTGTNSSLIQLQNTGGVLYYGLDSSGGGLGGAYTANIWHTGNYSIVFATNNTARAYIDGSGNVLLGGSATPASAAASLAIFNGTAPTGSVANGIVLYAEDVSASSELKVRDEAGNVTTLSPHNFSLIPEGPSEEMAWAYYSEKNGRRINVDMLKLARMVEKLTGEKLVYES